MKYTKNERVAIGEQVYKHQLTQVEAADKYNIARSTVERYVEDYKEYSGISAQRTNTKKPSTVPDIEAYMSMSKEELINELILAKANELRAKKGYEVKGVGANKEFIPLNNKNSKS